MNRWGRLLTVPLAVSLAATLPVAYVGASSPLPGWSHADSSRMPFVFVSSRIVTVAGAVGANGTCTIGLTIEHAAGSPPVTAIPVAWNEATCQEQFEVGTTNPADPLASLGISPLLNEAPAQPSVLQQHGYFYSYYHDPAWIVVNSLEDEMTWNYDGTYITQIVAAWDAWTYFSVPGDHWYLTSHSGPRQVVAYNDTWATLTSSASFYNTDFCGGTGTSYTSNQLAALGSGSDRGSIQAHSAWGCDSGWLSYGHTLY